MAQDLPATIDTEIAAEQSQPILLFELYLVSGTLRYAATISNIVFPVGGSTYYGKSIQLSNIKTSAEGEISRASIQFDNVASDMHYYNALEKFDAKQIIIKKVYRDQLGDATYYREVFNGFMEEPKSVDKKWMAIDIVSGTPLQRKVLQEYYQKECNNVFGDTRCNYSGYANLASLTATGTADSGSISTLVDNALTQADDYWNFGKIEVTISGVVFKRRIEDFNAASDTLTFDVSLPISVVSGSTYVLYKGCPNTWDACRALAAYGPSSDNSANFNGFIHIGRLPKDGV
jgi:hypothetical protein